MIPADTDGSGRPVLSASQEDHLDDLEQEISVELFNDEDSVELASTILAARSALQEFAALGLPRTSDAFAHLLREADRLHKNLQEAVDKRLELDQKAAEDARAEALLDAQGDFV